MTKEWSPNTIALFALVGLVGYVVMTKVVFKGLGPSKFGSLTALYE